jgi:hypothetical protein
MQCKGGKHEWSAAIDAQRCCSAEWQRITILPGERVRDILASDPRVASDGINYAPDGFRFAWVRVEPAPPQSS